MVPAKSTKQQMDQLSKEQMKRAYWSIYQLKSHVSSPRTLAEGTREQKAVNNQLTLKVWTPAGIQGSVNVAKCFPDARVYEPALHLNFLMMIICQYFVYCCEQKRLTLIKDKSGYGLIKTCQAEKVFLWQDRHIWDMS